jgi:hypothetical protein
MKKLIMLPIFSFFFISLLFLCSNQTLAQGTAHCKIEGTGPTAQCVLVNNCDSGCEPTINCSVSTNICNSITSQPCDCEPPPEPPPPGSGCVTFGSFPGGCRGAYPFRCTDGATYNWCCTNQSACEQIAPAPPAPSPSGPGGGEGGSIRTAIGDIDPRNLQGFIQQLLNLALGVAGGIAFLLMLFGAFQIMTSSGNPEKMKSGSELITSALTGLLFIIFSIFLLKFIGVDILQIPGFGK